MEPENLPDIEETAPGADTEPSQDDPVEQELKRVQEKPKRSRLETLEYNRNRLQKEIEDEKAKAGIVEEEDDNRPLTVAEFKAMNAREAQATALSLAESIENESDRKLTLYHLENTIRPSGDAHTDLLNAQLIVNSVRNGMLAEESARSAKARSLPGAPSAPPRQRGAEPEFSSDESKIIKGFGLTAEEAKKALEG